MGTEIERRFLVVSAPSLVADYPGQPIEQGYLGFGADGAETRLRRAGTSLSLTVKRGYGLVRREHEITVSDEQFVVLWEATEGLRLMKTRHVIPVAGHRIELDVYAGELAGLIIAEVEFASIEASATFVPPPWCGPEITTDERFRNRSVVGLSKSGVRALLEAASGG